MPGNKIEIAIGQIVANLICLEQTDQSCENCCFQSTEDCTNIACTKNERQDKKHVIYKVRGDNECS